jgi:hypothetical protein
MTLISLHAAGPGKHYDIPDAHNGRILLPGAACFKDGAPRLAL